MNLLYNILLIERGVNGNIEYSDFIFRQSLYMYRAIPIHCH